MKKIRIYLPVLLFVAVAILLSGCKKIEEAILKDPCADFKFCNIKSFTLSGDFPGNKFTFTYDAWGNPLSVSSTAVGTGAPNRQFKYDGLHRLTEYIWPYNNGSFESWTKYVYDASGRIAFDTSYALGNITPSGPANYLWARLTTYTYDGTCRVIKTSAVALGGKAGDTTVYVSLYSYDSNGNLIRPGIVYDNKVNIHRTNKVFMFVDRDYSMNNPFTASKYNAYGLPSTISPPAAGGPFYYFLLRPIFGATFVYQCD